MTAPAAVWVRACPLCGTAPGEPCQARPAADHLARYLDSDTAGQLTRAYMAKTLGELVVIAPPVVHRVTPARGLGDVTREWFPGQRGVSGP